MTRFFRNLRYAAIVILLLVFIRLHLVVQLESSTSELRSNAPPLLDDLLPLLLQAKSSLSRTIHRDPYAAYIDPTFTGYWNLSHPVWPERRPHVRDDCKVVFRDPDLQICHIIPWGANFGDEIGPPITRRILELYFNCSAKNIATYDLSNNGRYHLNRSRPCLFVVGSLWRFMITGDHVWGTGAVYEDVIRKRCRYLKRNPSQQILNLTIYSSRGPRSAADIHQFCPFASQPAAASIPTAGDGGFLIPYLFPEYVNRSALDHEEAYQQQTSNKSNKYDFCIIPHHQERKHPDIKKATRLYHARRLSVSRSWENMTLIMQEQCRQVLSSSLHGIIFAESLGIPNRRLRLSAHPGDFKFADAYESFRGIEPLYATNVSYALETIQAPLPPQQREAYARRVLETFPIHLFTSVPAFLDLPKQALEGSQML